MAWGSKELSMRSWSHRLVALSWTVAAALACACAGYGCSNSNGNINTKLDAEAVCPNTVSAAVGAKCAYEGLVCEIGYTCGSFEQQATCTCNFGRTFDCTDSTGTGVDPGGDPACTSNGGPHDKECPGSEALAAGASCKTPRLICPYANNCPPVNNVGSFDTCECTAGAGKTGGFAFVCEPKCGVPDAGDDGSADAPADTPIDSPADSSGDAPKDGPSSG
jgi:hypothetical protein